MSELWDGNSEFWWKKSEWQNVNLEFYEKCQNCEMEIRNYGEKSQNGKM